MEILDVEVGEDTFFAPKESNVSQRAEPMPDAAPVTTTTFW